MKIAWSNFDGSRNFEEFSDNNLKAPISIRKIESVKLSSKFMRFDKKKILTCLSFTERFLEPVRSDVLKVMKLLSLSIVGHILTIGHREWPIRVVMVKRFEKRMVGCRGWPVDESLNLGIDLLKKKIGSWRVSCKEIRLGGSIKKLPIWKSQTKIKLNSKIQATRFKQSGRANIELLNVCVLLPGEELFWTL